MKEIVEYLQKKNIIFKSLKEISPKELGSRKKIELYFGTDLKGYYTLVMQVEKKSRVLRKEVGELLVLHEKKVLILRILVDNSFGKINCIKNLWLD